MQNPLVILAIDTSLGACSVALLKDGVIAAQNEEPFPGSQSRVLVPMIERVLEEAELGYDDLTAIACTVGPGGFTGIRVGLATARAIALGANKPLIGLSTLETIAYGTNAQADILATIDAHRGQHYVQRFRRNGHLIPQSDALLVDTKMLPVLSHGAKIVEGPPRALDAARLAAEKWSSGERDFPNSPLYLRKPDAKLPAKQGLKCGEELL